MNVMCILTQFVVSTPTYNITAENIENLFMEEVFLNFRTCSVIYDGITFRGAFQTMCKALKITYWCISRGNHKGNSVENFHWFLNKNQTISDCDWEKHYYGFVQNEKTSQYAWKSAPIGDIYISWSLAAIGREFRFLLDVDICHSQSMNTSDNSALFQYLRDFSTDSQFATSVL